MKYNLTFGVEVTPEEKNLLAPKRVAGLLLLFNEEMGEHPEIIKGIMRKLINKRGKDKTRQDLVSLSLFFQKLKEIKPRGRPRGYRKSQEGNSNEL